MARWTRAGVAVTVLVLIGMAVFVTAVYAVVVRGGGMLLGALDRPHIGLSVLATAIVALGFEPVRRSLHRAAVRLASHRRAGPYELLTGFDPEVVATDEVPERMARLLAEATGARSAQVLLSVGGAPVPARRPRRRTAPYGRGHRTRGAAPPTPHPGRCTPIGSGRRRRDGVDAAPAGTGHRGGAGRAAGGHPRRVPRHSDPPWAGCRAARPRHPDRPLRRRHDRGRTGGPEVRRARGNRRVLLRRGTAPGGGHLVALHRGRLVGTSGHRRPDRADAVLDRVAAAGGRVSWLAGPDGRYAVRVELPVQPPPAPAQTAASRSMPNDDLAT